MDTPITNKSRPPNKRLKLSVALTSSLVAAAMGPASVRAQEWRFSPTLDLRQTYTDNVRLLPSGAEKSDFITEITPGFIVSGGGRGLKASASYAMQYLKYARDSEGSAINHRLDAAAHAELIEDLFFVDGNANVNQQNISALGPQAIDNTNVTANRGTVRTYSVSPYLRHRFGSTALSEARYTRSSTSSETGGLSDADSDALLLSLSSGPAFNTLGWTVLHSRQKNQFDSEQDADSSTTSGSLRYILTPQFQLTATGGYDKYDYVSVAEQPSGRFYTGGFSWMPSERTSIAASAGRRFWGKTYMVQSSVRSRLALWNLSYDEGITTSHQQFAIQATNNTSAFINQMFLASIPDPVARQRAVDRFILSTGLPPALSRPVNYFTNQFFLQKSWQASAAFIGARNTLILGVNNTSRRAQTAASATELGSASQSLDANTKQTAVTGAWQWRVTTFTSASLNAAYARTRVETIDDVQTTKSLRAVIATQFHPKASGGLELRRQMQSSSSNRSLAGSDYVENAVTAFVSMRF